MREINELMEVKPDIIALDATHSLRPGGRTLDEFYREIRKSYPEQLLMADCSTVEEALFADQLGFDFIGTTLVGYTDQSRDLKIESNDFEIMPDCGKGETPRHCGGEHQHAGKGKESY